MSGNRKTILFQAGSIYWEEAEISAELALELASLWAVESGIAARAFRPTESGRLAGLAIDATNAARAALQWKAAAA